METIIKNVFPVVHLHIVRRIDPKRTITVAELCAPRILEILPGETTDAGKPARLRFDCHVFPPSEDADVPAIAIKGILNREGGFSAAPAYMEKIEMGETSLIAGPGAQAIATEILCRVPNEMAVIWYVGGGAIWSAEYGNEAEKPADIMNAVTSVLNSSLTVIDVETRKVLV